MTAEKEMLYRHRLEEGYDVQDDSEYEEWKMRKSLAIILASYNFVDTFMQVPPSKKRCNQVGSNSC